MSLGDALGWWFLVFCCVFLIWGAINSGVETPGLPFRVVLAGSVFWPLTAAWGLLYLTLISCQGLALAIPLANKALQDRMAAFNKQMDELYQDDDD